MALRCTQAIPARRSPAKLGMKDGMAAAFIALPDRNWTNWPTAVGLRSSSTGCARLVGRSAGARRKYDVIHAFTRQRAEIEDHLGAVCRTRDQARRHDLGVVAEEGSKVATDVTEDVIRAEALKLDLVDVKVAAIDEIWSGLKLVIRKDRR